MSSSVSMKKAMSRDIPFTDDVWKNIPIAIRYAWKDYIITGVITLATLLAIIFNHKLTKQQLAAIVAATGMTGKTLSEYKKKVEELYGKDAIKEIAESIAKEKKEQILDKDIQVASMPILRFMTYDLDEEYKLFYDSISETWFYAKPMAVHEAIKHLNRCFQARAVSGYKEFVEMLGYDIDFKVFSEYQFEHMGWGSKMIDNGLVPFIDIEIYEETGMGNDKWYIISSDLYYPEFLDDDDYECINKPGHTWIDGEPSPVPMFAPITS